MAAAISPTRSPPIRRPITPMIATVAVPQATVIIRCRLTGSLTPADDGHECRRQRAVLGTWLVDEQLTEPHAVSQLTSLKAVVERVVQHQAAVPLGYDEANDPQQRAEGHDDRQAYSEVSPSLGVAHSERGYCSPVTPACYRRRVARSVSAMGEARSLRACRRTGSERAIPRPGWQPGQATGEFWRASYTPDGPATIRISWTTHGVDSTRGELEAIGSSSGRRR